MAMNRICVLIAFVMILSGCVASNFQKSVTVTKNGEGKILQTVETETVVQQGQGYAIQFEHIKGVQNSNSSNQ